MNPDPSSDPLRDTLSEWQVRPEAQPHFRNEVWERIERDRAASVSFGLWLRQHAAGVGVAAASAILVAATGGALTAKLHSSENNREREIAAYVHSIDPHRQVLADFSH